MVAVFKTCSKSCCLCDLICCRIFYNGFEAHRFTHLALISFLQKIRNQIFVPGISRAASRCVFKLNYFYFTVKHNLLYQGRKWKHVSRECSYRSTSHGVTTRKYNIDNGHKYCKYFCSLEARTEWKHVVEKTRLCNLNVCLVLSPGFLAVW